MLAEDLISKYNLKLERSSLKSYIQCLRTVGVHNENELNMLEDVEEMKRVILSIQNLNTACKLLFSIGFFLKRVLDRVDLADKLYSDSSIRKLLNDRKISLMKNEFSGNEKYKDLKLSDLKTTFESKWSKLEDLMEQDVDIGLSNEKQISLVQQYFLVSLYLFHEPLRNNYSHLVYIKSSESEPESAINYLIDYGVHFEIVVRNFKTRKFYKEIRFKLGEISSRIMFKLRELKKLKHGNLVVTNRSGTYYSNGTTKIVSDASKAILGVDLSCNDYRHMYVIELLKSPEYLNMTVAERELTAFRMGHSYLTQQLYNRV